MSRVTAQTYIASCVAALSASVSIVYVIIIYLIPKYIHSLVKLQSVYIYLFPWASSDSNQGRFRQFVARIEQAIKTYNSSLVWQASLIGISDQVELTFITKEPTIFRSISSDCTSYKFNF